VSRQRKGMKVSRTQSFMLFIIALVLDVGSHMELHRSHDTVALSKRWAQWWRRERRTVRSAPVATFAH
jgi:hypothetical protein